jgi:hypothetical protein
MTLHIHPDKTVPYPDGIEPDKTATLREDMQVAANTAAVLKGLGGQYDESPEDQAGADAVFAEFSELAKQQFEDAMSGKSKRAKRPPPPALLERVSVADRIGTMLREYNNPIVADAAELRLVVTNKLLDLAGCGDPRIEIKATEMLGKISDVGLFSEKTEITVTYNNVSDIDEAIKDKIRKMMRLHAIDVPSVELDVSKEFGVPEEVEDIATKESGNDI